MPSSPLSQQSRQSPIGVDSVTMLLVLLLATTVLADYWQDRASLVSQDFCHAVGSSIVLSVKEHRVNDLLMALKYREYDAGFQNPGSFPPAQHFFKSRSSIEQSEVFHFIQKLPKGASLHSHDAALVSLEYLYNLTFKDNLYVRQEGGRFQLHFFGTSQPGWSLVQDMRENNSSFDQELKDQLSIIVDDPAKAYPTITEAWNKFLETFGTVFGLISYRPVFYDYFYQVLQELYEDNVIYIEFRTILPVLYDLDGTTYDYQETVKVYSECVNDFRKNYPDFQGARLIYAPSRQVDNKTANNYVAMATKLKQLYPDFVAGFDLVGQEDSGKPLVNFIPQLLQLAKEGMKFFFHAAETDWEGTSTDMNLFDAVLLNATRIGHGYGVVKHPQILEEVVRRDIAIEISPISNQVLKLVEDLRNHPGAFLLAAGYPVVITNDDPGFWGAKGLSYDWYMAFMGFASREADLKLLKQLAVNSLKYSALEGEEKCAAFLQWEERWEKFLESVLEGDFVRRYFDRYYVNNVR